MGRPGVGNPGNKGGKPGVSGRKSAWEEKQDANFLSDVWEKAQDITALEQKVLSKKYSGREITALRLLKGSERLMAKFMDKLLPDLSKQEIGGMDGKELVLKIIKFNEDDTSPSKE